MSWSIKICVVGKKSWNVFFFHQNIQSTLCNETISKTRKKWSYCTGGLYTKGGLKVKKHFWDQTQQRKHVLDNAILFFWNIVKIFKKLAYGQNISYVIVFFGRFENQVLKINLSSNNIYFFFIYWFILFYLYIYLL